MSLQCPRDKKQKKRGTDIPRLLMEVVRITLQEDVTITAHAKTREPPYSLACENFSRFHQQDEHNASCFSMSAAQIRHKNRYKDSTFLINKRNKPIF